MGGGARPPPKRNRVRRLIFVWFSIELAAGIVALSEIVFALPSVILLEAGRTAADLILPPTVLSGAVAVYLGWSALPLVAEVAKLGQTL
jgi:hypothetical protein